MSKPLTISKKVVGIARGTAIQAGDTTKNQSISITKKQVQTGQYISRDCDNYYVLKINGIETILPSGILSRM